MNADLPTTICRLIGRGHAQLAKAMLVNGRPV